MFELLEKSDVGTIQLGDKARVSDPCYEMDVWCAGTVENVLPGEYQCFVQTADTGDWGIRVSSIEVRHKNFLDVDPTEIQEFEVGVDSGQAGIYDLSYYEGIQNDEEFKEKWYDRVCSITGEYYDNPDFVPFDKSSYWKDSFKAIHILKEGESSAFNSMVDSGFSKVDAILDLLHSDNPNEKISDPQVAKYLEERRKYLEQNREERIEYIEAKQDWEHSHEGVKKLFRFCGHSIDNKGLVSSSGDGDGGYTCFVGRDTDGKVVSIKVDFYYYDDSEDCEGEE